MLTAGQQTVKKTPVSSTEELRIVEGEGSLPDNTDFNGTIFLQYNFDLHLICRWYDLDLHLNGT